MARESMCVQCSMNFLSYDEYEQHKRSGHTIPGITIVDPGQSLPSGIPMSALPDEDFAQRIKEMEESQATPPTDPITAEAHKKEMAARLEDLKVKPKTLILTYQWTGDCPTCVKAVSTLELKVEKRCFSIAFCDQCRNQINQREVVDLNLPKGLTK